jgi:similar to spore coat protein
MNEQSIALNESLQLHELLTFKNLCLTKSITMSPLTSDSQLKSILENDVTLTQKHIRELKGIMEHSSIMTLHNS